MIEKLNYPQVGLLILAWFVADLLTPIVMHLCHKMGAVDKPHTYKIHKAPVPFLGGIVIYVAFSIAIFSILRFTSFEENKDVFSIIFGGFLITILGCIDDFKPISAVIKLIVLIIATYFLSYFEVRISLTLIKPLDMGLTLLWIAGVASAMNSIDNMDGASTGIGALAAFFTFYVAWYANPPQRGLSFVAIALLGACLGFLRYNFKPAKIFLGDNGSLLLGFLLASITVLAGWSKKDPLKAVIVPCAILAVPLYDITLSTILRYKNRVVKNFKEAIIYCGRDHLSHRLVALGLSEREAVLTLYLFGAISGGIAILITQEEITRSTYLPITLIACVALIAIGLILDRAKVYTHEETEKT